MKLFLLFAIVVNAAVILTGRAMKLFLLFAIIVNAAVVILTGCTSFIFFQNGNFENALLEVGICFISFHLYIINCIRLKFAISK